MIDWEKYGFKSFRFNEKEIYQREGFPLVLIVENEFLTVICHNAAPLSSVKGPHIISTATIPATNQAVVLLLKAFNVSKNPDGKESK